MIPIQPFADDQSAATYINSNSPVGLRSSAMIVSQAMLNTLFKHLTTDSGAWDWNHDLSALSLGWAQLRFNLIDQNITQEINSTGGNFAVFVWPSVATTLDLEFMQAFATNPVVFRVSVQASSWSKIALTSAQLTSAGLDLTNIAYVAIRVTKNLDADSARLYVNGVRGP